jgi:hypothetical protein
VREKECDNDSQSKLDLLSMAVSQHVVSFTLRGKAERNWMRLLGCLIDSMSPRKENRREEGKKVGGEELHRCNQKGAQNKKGKPTVGNRRF